MTKKLSEGLLKVGALLADDIVAAGMREYFKKRKEKKRKPFSENTVEVIKKPLKPTHPKRYLVTNITKESLDSSPNLNYTRYTDNILEGKIKENEMISVKASELKHSGDPDSNFDPVQLAAGIKVEMEHTDDPEVAKAIAKSHISEFKNYYIELAKMEDNLKSQKGN